MTPGPRSNHLRPPRAVDIAVPVNGLSRAKTRLQAPPEVRRRLVIAFLTDTLHAALECTSVRTVTVITDDAAVQRAARSAGAVTFAPHLPRPGLNRDITAFARASIDDHPIAVIPADLPAVTASALTVALAECAAHDIAFVRDQQDTGTTLLYSRRASALHPAFGMRSADRHQSAGAQPLTRVDPGLRRDVDTLSDLRAAQSLGVGASTWAAINAHIEVLSPSLHRQ